MGKHTLPTHSTDWLNEQFSVVQGFDISTLFFSYLWPSLKAKFPKMPEADVEVYDLFTFICMGFETSAEWNKAIYRLKKIRKDDQINMKLSARDVFFCSIELCKICSARFEEGSYSYVINLLEDMNNHPENHLFEWSIWEKAVEDSFTTEFHPFSWLHDLRKPETEDYP